jgi:hypothetical protein
VSKTNACENILRLLKDLKVNLDDYKDEKWCENYTLDEYFLYVLCWAGWRPQRQQNVWKEVRKNFKKLNKPLHTFQPADVKKLCATYPLSWQKKWLQKLTNFLIKNSLTTRKFVNMLRKMGYEEARRKLREIVRTESEKIVDCWLRDIVRLDAFPIDSRIKSLLREYRIPVDSDFIITCCKRNNIPIRPFNRALYVYAGTKNAKR